MNWLWILAIVVAAYVLILVAAKRYLKPFANRLGLCLLPIFLAGWVVARAVGYYQAGEGGFKLGVDLVGGTILVYEVDLSKFPDGKLPQDYKPEMLAASLKRRIDPADLYNVTIRPVSNTRVEIILPTGGEHQAQVEEKKWENLIQEVADRWAPTKEQDYQVGRGQVLDLIQAVSKDHPDVNPPDIESFINQRYQASRDFSSEQIQKVKEKIAQVGLLEFRILANQVDDRDGIDAAKKYLTQAQTDPTLKTELKKRALLDQPPPPPPPPSPEGFPTTRPELGRHTYSWVELSNQQRHEMGLANPAPQELKDPNKANPGPDDLKDSNSRRLWAELARDREKGGVFDYADWGQSVLWSRECIAEGLPEKDRNKKWEYFILTRDPDPGAAITGDYLVSANETNDSRGQIAVGFHFNERGGQLFYDVTSKNAPKGEDTGDAGFRRHLAIILDHQIVSAPRLNQAIRTDGIIEGKFTKDQVDLLVTILRAGALPATLKPQPVSESTMGATLGADTIKKGTYAVGVAFLAILIFMMIYYRFAGFVASVALLANLLLTVAFMVAVKATFTLPGLAGLVLMLGMAVDANVLIYERLREERDRGAGLSLAIRNGYDRAFPTIIDTHLSSIFTAIVLYAVGNDQLKGFGVSLTVGLIISLFTSLVMTRVMFDIWMYQNWLPKLGMFRLFSRPNINFMGIRYYWFTATILLTIIGISVFIGRLPQDLNIDFMGGTAYGGQLTQPENIQWLRDQLDENRQKDVLAVKEVKQLDGEGMAFSITYQDGDTWRVNLPNKATPQEVKDRAQMLPDPSVEIIFPGATTGYGNESRYFTVRTSEKAPDLVQAAISRLLGDQLKKMEMSFTPDQDGRGAALHFMDPNDPNKGTAKEAPVHASPSQIAAILQQTFKDHEIAQGPTITGEKATEGKGDESDRYSTMRLTLHDPVAMPALTAALTEAKTEFDKRPVYDRLENFDSQLAKETQTRAMYAILASWGAILLYLWFRFGSWTFGLAAVLCLIHDLFFTMGIIAFCHFIHLHMPWLAKALLLEDFKIDLPAVAALLTLVGYSVNDTIVVFDRIREVRGKNPELTPQTINDSVNQTLSRTLLTSFATWLVVIVLYIFGGEGVHLFAFCMVIGVIVGTYSSIYIASPLLLIFGEGAKPTTVRERRPQPVGSPAV
ncbi:MAG: protein translocase subunit SecD [Planctomycetes bacterium]|nr:protein translocase subunit SecD [Planctomycetota bacterium]